MDVDGVLTDGKLIYFDGAGEAKAFHVRDGYGIKRLIEYGVVVAIITGRESEVVLRRAEELGIPHVIQGSEDKRSSLESLVNQLNIDPEHVAYIGDDLPDLPALEYAGISVTVPNAPQEILDHVDLVTDHPGGEGAVRDLCDLLINASK